MRRLLITAGIVALSLAIVTGVWARATGRIVGSPKSEVLRGTQKADWVDGRAGNDTLYGLAGKDVLIGSRGNDKLVGGPGKDNLRCGPGADIAVADATDVVGSDCESVKGLPAPPAEPTPPPAPPPPPAQQAVAGHYCGFTNQGKSICFDVTAGRVGNFETTSDVTCGDRVFTVALGFGGPTTIQSDLSFSYAYSGELTTDDPELKVTTSYAVTGKLDTAGNATGSLNLSRLSFDYRGVHIDCAAAPYAWQARAGA